MSVLTAFHRLVDVLDTTSYVACQPALITAAFRLEEDDALHGAGAGTFFLFSLLTFFLALKLKWMIDGY